MKALFQDLIGNKVTIEIPKDKQLNEFKNDIMSKYKVDPKKKEVEVFYQNQKLENESTLESIKYKEGDVISVMFKKISEPKPQPKAKPQEQAKPETSTQTASTSQTTQTASTSQTAQPPQSTPSAPSTQQRPPLQPTDAGLPVKSQQPDASQPYPPTQPTLDDIGRVNCFKVRDLIVRTNPDLVISALQRFNPQLSERVRANPGPFLSMFGIQQAPQYVNDMINNIDQMLSQYTPQERESIQRLRNMGFDLDTVVQIFEVAERDEQRARMILSNL